MGLVLLSPLAGLVVLGAAVPVGVALLAARRGRQVAAILGLTPAPLGLNVPRAACAVTICVLLGLAAAQPVVQTTGSERVRRSSEVLFVVDVSRSMLASGGRDGPTRLERAKDVVLALHRAVPDVPAAVAGLTDRVLPYVFATSDDGTFENVVRRSVAVEAPPPQDVARNATSFGALAAVQSSGFFPSSARHRTCVLVTDGETAPYSSADVAAALGGGRGCSLLVVQVWAPGERVYGADGRPEAAYRPDGTARSLVQRLAQVTSGQSFDAAQAPQAARALRLLAEVGPTERVTAVERQRRLAPALAAMALALAVALALSARPEEFRARAPHAYSADMHPTDRAA
ncbi:MAG TPA: VWA domain-containing protein [Gaiella sp.]|jgi:hypothetical protein